MSIGTRIREIRKAKNLTQIELGKRCGMADSAIRRYESDRVKPKIQTLQKIANALDVSLLDLYEPADLNIDFDNLVEISPGIYIDKDTPKDYKDNLILKLKNQQPKSVPTEKEIELFLDFLEDIGYKISEYEELIGIESFSHDYVTFFNNENLKEFFLSVKEVINHELHKQFTKK